MNPYYNPEEIELEMIWSIDTGRSYEFDIFAVWKDKNGKLFYATDSGCSCPVPFEGSRLAMNDLNNDTYYNFKQALENHYEIKRDDINKCINIVNQHGVFKSSNIYGENTPLGPQSYNQEQRFFDPK